MVLNWNVLVKNDTGMVEIASGFMQLVTGDELKTARNKLPVALIFTCTKYL